MKKITPTRGKYLCEIISREQQTQSGLWLVEGRQAQKQDNICRCLSVGKQAIKTCYPCHEWRSCKQKCRYKDKPIPILAQEGDIIHFKHAFGEKFRYDNKRYIMLRNDDIIAVQTKDKIKAVGSMVIIRLKYATKMSGVIVPDQAKSLSGEYWGEVVSVGPEFMDQELKEGDKLLYLRNEGYRFRIYPNKEEAYAIKEKWCGGKVC